MNSAQEIAGGLIVAGSDATVLLKSGEEILDQVPGLVQMLVPAALILARTARGDHDGLASFLQRRDHSVLGVIGLVCNEPIGLSVFKQNACTVQIVGLSGREVKARRIAKRIDQGMDLGAQSAARATDRLVLADFFWAPALC
jgi:hypothetical protein